jgi:hypothetical protein
MMRDLGMEPPPLPFVIAPGEYTLYHEWGHHVDRTWSADTDEVSFSFRWFSRFYELGVRASPVATRTTTSTQTVSTSDQSSATPMPPTPLSSGGTRHQSCLPTYSRTGCAGREGLLGTSANRKA